MRPEGPRERCRNRRRRTMKLKMSWIAVFLLTVLPCALHAAAPAKAPPKIDPAEKAFLDAMAKDEEAAKTADKFSTLNQYVSQGKLELYPDLLIPDPAKPLNVNKPVGTFTDTK